MTTQHCQRNDDSQYYQCSDDSTRLALARQALIDTGYFTPEQVGPDVAPRIIELHAALVSRLEEAYEHGRRQGIKDTLAAVALGQLTRPADPSGGSVPDSTRRE